MSESKTEIIFLENNTKIVVDYAIKDKILKYNWFVSIRKERTNITATINGKQMTIQRFIYTCYYEVADDQFICNTDIDQTNLTIHNLIACDKSELGFFKQKTKNKKSSCYKGVYFDIQKKLWRASIKINNQSISLGTHETEIEAALAYQKYLQVHIEKIKLRKKYSMRPTTEFLVIL